MTHHLKPIMFAGTGSDVGKSLLVAGMCRILRQDGYNPAPFKAQNMALNSYVTTDGLELGRAQAMQAEAAGIECCAEMNPMLLKPIGDCTSQVILNGRPVGNHSAKDYFNISVRKVIEQEVHAAFDRLSHQYNPIVMEGAGSIAEVNLYDLDLVNMPMARYANAPVILVADIRRGGVFASAYGSIALQPPNDKKRIKGIIVNQFRGDASLFEQGRRQLEQICGVPVIGVMPYIEDLHIEEEDSYFQKKKRANLGEKRLKVAIVRLSHISNFTDFDPLECHPMLDVHYTSDPTAIEEADIIILPGSKATISDLKELYDNGVARSIITAHNRGKSIVGICGGFQMMGRTIADPLHIEGETQQIAALGLLPCSTTITAEKVTRRIGFKLHGKEMPCTGYEIHMGKTSVEASAKPFATLEDGCADGCRVSDRCYGSYIHGLFENSTVIDTLLAPFSCVKHDFDFDYRAFKESQYDRLAHAMRQHLDIDMIYEIMS